MLYSKSVSYTHLDVYKRQAVIGMIIGTLTVSIVSVFSNLYLIIPFYAKLFGMTMQDIVAMCTEVNPKVTDAFTTVSYTHLDVYKRQI